MIVCVNARVCVSSSAIEISLLLFPSSIYIFINVCVLRNKLKKKVIGIKGDKRCSLSISVLWRYLYIFGQKFIFCFLFVKNYFMKCLGIFLVTFTFLADWHDFLRFRSVDWFNRFWNFSNSQTHSLQGRSLGIDS